MKRFLATGVAAAVAMTAFAAFPTSASAHGWKPYYAYGGYYYAPPPPPVYYYAPRPYYYYDPGPAIVAGAIGAFLGAVITHPRHHKVYKKYKRH